MKLMVVLHNFHMGKILKSKHSECGGILYTVAKLPRRNNTQIMKVDFTHVIK